MTILQFRVAAAVLLVYKHCTVQLAQLVEQPEN